MNIIATVLNPLLTLFINYKSIIIESFSKALNNVLTSTFLEINVHDGLSASRFDRHTGSSDINVWIGLLKLEFEHTVQNDHYPRELGEFLCHICTMYSG
ncbi:hypothetical protein HTG_08300 [Natrinema mahii]|nr:hypothetical protein HTG_08300 [Natrinema mahii]